MNLEEELEDEKVEEETEVEEKVVQNGKEVEEGLEPQLYGLMPFALATTQ